MWWIVVVAVIALTAIGVALFFVLREPRNNGVSNLDEPEGELGFDGNRSIRTPQEAFGKRGEDSVFAVLSKIAKEHGGYAYRGIVLEDDDGFSTEIDAVLICSGGFFVIEVKSNKGIIRGSLNGEQWFARKREGQKEQEFRNPIKQNKGHIGYLKRIMGEEAPHMTSLVVFPFASITLLPSDTTNVVFNLFDAQDFILGRIESGRYDRQTVDQVNDYFKSLIACYGISHERHMGNLKKKYGA